MDSKKNDSAPLTFIVLTPHGEAANLACDSVHLTICDDENGHGGGLVGFHRGHVPAVLALGNGIAEAKLGGKTIFRSVVQGGFASVRDDVIRVITDSVKECAENGDN